MLQPERDAQIIELCHWTQNRDGARDSETHWSYHDGSPCPYDVVVAVLNGEPDPRERVAEWVIVLPFADGKPPLSLNDRGNHWAAKASKVEKIKALTRNAVRDADVPHLDHVHVELHYQPKINRVRDADNTVATLKPIIDALHQPDEASRFEPIVDGDDPRYVSWSRPRLHPARRGEGARTWLILRSHG